MKRISRRLWARATSSSVSPSSNSRTAASLVRTPIPPALMSDCRPAIQIYALGYAGCPRASLSHCCRVGCVAVERLIFEGDRVLAWLEVGKDRRVGQRLVNCQLHLFANVVAALDRPIARYEHVHRDEAPRAG